MIIRRRRSPASNSAEHAAAPSERRTVEQPRTSRRGWDLGQLRSEVEGEFRAVGARVWREERA